jgi:hypothetical protein
MMVVLKDITHVYTSLTLKGKVFLCKDVNVRPPVIVLLYFLNKDIITRKQKVVLHPTFLNKNQIELSENA